MIMLTFNVCDILYFSKWTYSDSIKWDKPEVPYFHTPPLLSNVVHARMKLGDIIGANNGTVYYKLHDYVYDN